jgi:hypothetical protein
MLFQRFDVRFGERKKAQTILAASRANIFFVVCRIEQSDVVEKLPDWMRGVSRIRKIRIFEFILDAAVVQVFVILLQMANEERCRSNGSA